MINVPKINITPRELHAIWVLLKQVQYFPIKKLESIAKKVFLVANKKDIENLLKAAEILGLVNKIDNGWIINHNYGSSYGNLEHWRLWQVPEDLKGIINQDIKNLFLSKKFYEKRPIVIDLFSGAGGLGLGFLAEGFNVKFAFERDAQACEAHRKNFPECKIVETDIRQVSQNIRKIISEDLEPSQICGIIGGPPCQGFSPVGERNYDDERNLLTTHFINIVLDIEPSFFVMENVVGLKSSGIRPDFLTFLKRYSNPIGSIANKIVNSLPEIDNVTAKRERQYRRKLISEIILELRKKSESNVEIFKSFEDYKNFIEELYIDLGKSLFDVLESKYPSELWSEIFEILSSYNIELYKIIISLVLEYSLKSKQINKQDLETTITSWINLSQNGLIKKACQGIIDDYYNLLEAVNYQGVNIGPVLNNLIERVSSKYEVAVPTTLNSAWYGSPQNRERLFLIGIHKRHKKSFIFPKPQFQATGKKNPQKLLNLPLSPTTFEALADLPDVDKYNFLLKQDILPIHYLSSPVSQFSALSRLESIDVTDKSLPRPSWNPFLIDCCLRTQHPGHVIERIKNTPEGKSEAISGRTRLNRNSVSHTLRAGTKEDKGSHTANRPVHYQYNRVITVREGARLMGYPDWMTFHHTKWHGFRLVGNGVPLHLGRSVARKIMELLV